VTLVARTTRSVSLTDAWKRLLEAAGPAVAQERGRRTWRIPVRGSLVVNDGLFCAAWAEQGPGLAYAMEPLVSEQLDRGSLQRVLERYAATVPGFFLYCPSRTQSSDALRLFVETVRELVGQRTAAKAPPQR
jgi:DNA-binding transcriptional LysR family regulator